MKTDKITIKALKKRIADLRYRGINYSERSDYYYFCNDNMPINSIQLAVELYIDSNISYYLLPVYTITVISKDIFLNCYKPYSSNINSLGNTILINSEQLSDILDCLEEAQANNTTEQECQQLLKLAFDMLKEICHKHKTT